jgi:hypothetical protein
MPRLARLPFVAFGWYYVALHSVTDRRMVTSHAELATMLNLLRVTLRKGGARLHAGYLGEREAHLALQVGEEPLTAITGSFQHEYARVFNRSHDVHGSLFRSHYHVILFQHQRWLVPLVHFIHRIRREASEDYAGGVWWSSDAVYRGTEKQEWVTTNVALRMLTRGAYSRRVQEEAYRALLDRGPQPSHARLFRHGSEKDPRLLGDDQFITEMWHLTGRPPDRSRRTRHLEGDIPSVVRQVVEQFNALCDRRLPAYQAAAWRRLVNYENVCSRSRKRPLPMVRALSAAYVIEHGIATAMQAARFFGRGAKSVSVRRRRFYEERFHEWFGLMPEILFSPGRDGDRSVGRRSDDQVREVGYAGCSEFAGLCDCP